jgi:Na+-driven multidrug efflux pump
MWIKPLIIILLLALLVSLFSGLFFFVKDKGTTRRTFHSLGVRLGLTAGLVALLIYGVYTGQLGSNAPWDRELRGPAAEKNTAP